MLKNARKNSNHFALNNYNILLYKTYIKSIYSVFKFNHTWKKNFSLHTRGQTEFAEQPTVSVVITEVVFSRE
jgi:hypothetical protein